MSIYIRLRKVRLKYEIKKNQHGFTGIDNSEYFLKNNIISRGAF